MQIPGFSRRDDLAMANPAGGQVFLERRPGESAEAFEMRLAAAASEREGAIPPQADRREPHRAARPAGRPRRRGFGLVGAAVVLVAAIGALWLGLSAREGSFAAGGAVLDRTLAEVTHPARVAASEAVDRTGKAVQTAGQSLESQGERIRETAK